MNIVLPWPPSQLNPNRSKHWSLVAPFKKKYRAACGWQAVAQGAKKLQAERLTVHLTFYPPDRRPRDADNMLASMKSGLDGLADVLGVDDSKWTLTFEVSPDLGGMVRVEVKS